MTSPFNKPVGNEVFRTPFAEDSGPLPETFYTLNETGGRIILEDGSGFLLREVAP